jgi:hypothetical protein
MLVCAVVTGTVIVRGHSRFVEALPLAEEVPQLDGLPSDVATD